MRQTVQRWTGKMKGKNLLAFSIGLFVYGSEGYSFSTLVGHKTLHATNSSYNNSLSLNPALSPKAGGGKASSSQTQGTFFLLKNSRSANLSRNASANVDSTDGEMTSYGVSLLFDAGAGLYLTLNHERHYGDLSSKTTNSTRARSEEYSDIYSGARASVEITENVSVAVLVRFLDTSAQVYGNYFISADESTSYSGNLFGSGGGVKGSIPLAGSIKQLDFGLVYINPLKGKTEVYGEQLVITEPGVQEIGGSLVFNKFIAGMTIRRWVYKLDDRFFGTTYPNDNSSSVELMTLDPDKLTIFRMNHLQFGLDYKVSDRMTLRGSLAKEVAVVNFSPESDIPEAESGMEEINYNVYTFALNAKKNAIFFEGFVNIYDRSHTWNSGNNQRNYNGELTEYVFMLGTKL